MLEFNVIAKWCLYKAEGITIIWGTTMTEMHLVFMMNIGLRNMSFQFVMGIWWAKNGRTITLDDCPLKM